MRDLDIFNTEPGTKIYYVSQGGYPHQQQAADKLLAQGVPYTVETVDVHNYHTDIYLEEFPGIPFNSVMFRVDE